MIVFMIFLKSSTWFELIPGTPKRVVAFATHSLMAGDLPNLNQLALNSIQCLARALTQKGQQPKLGSGYSASSVK